MSNLSYNNYSSCNNCCQQIDLCYCQKKVQCQPNPDGQVGAPLMYPIAPA